MLKKYKYYSISVDIIDGKGRLFRVKAVINNKSVSNLVHLSLIN